MGSQEKIQEIIPKLFGEKIEIGVVSSIILDSLEIPGLPSSHIIGLGGWGFSSDEFAVLF